MRYCIIGAKGRQGHFYRNLLGESVASCIDIDNYDELNPGVKQADVIIITVPFDKVRDVILDLAKVVKKEQLVLNLSSLMEEHYNDMKKLECASAFLHGLFAPNVNSIKNVSFVLVPVKKNKKIVEFANFLREEGAKINEASAKEHDKSMALIQALSHFNSILLAKTLSSSNLTQRDIETYSTLFFRMYFDAISRIFSQSPEMYANLQFNNKYFKEALDSYEKNMKELKEIVSVKDFELYENVFGSVKKRLGKLVNSSFEESKTLADVMNNRTKYAVLGPEGSFTDEAIDFHDKKCEKIYFDNIGDVISALKNDMVDFAVVPMENSIGGTIAEAIDLIYINNLNIEKSLVLPIRYCAASLSNRGKPEIIMGHPQAFVQCSDFIDDNYPDARRVKTLSNSEAFKKIEENNLVDAVALGPEHAAGLYNLRVLSKGIENNKNNKTRFAIVSNSKSVNKKGEKSSIVINPGKDKPGLLFDLLKYFKEKRINLCRIESRPSRDKLGVYVFHVEFDGNIHDKKIKEAMQKIEKNAKVTCLGSYKQVEKNDKQN